MGEYKPVSDENLTAIARGDYYPREEEQGDIAAELLRLRRYHRGENRRAMQIRRLRWAVENMIVKVEVLSDQRSGSTAAAIATQRLTEKVMELHTLVQELPIDIWGPRSQLDYTGGGELGGDEPADGGRDG